MKMEKCLLAVLICVPIGAVILCNASENTTGVQSVEAVESLVLEVGPSKTLNPGYIACVTPELIPAEDESYDENACMSTDLLQTYSVDVSDVIVGDGLSEITVHLEDDQTAILYVKSTAIVEM